MFDTVLDRAEELAVYHAVTSEQRRLFTIAFQDTRRRLAERGVTAEALECVRLPRLVYAAIRGDDAPVLPLTVALTVLYVGMDLWDSVMDHELLPVWQDERPDAVALAAAALIGGVGPSSLHALGSPPTVIARLHLALANAFTAIAAGQQLDPALMDTANVPAERALRAIGGKSGEVVAVFAEAAAIMTEAPNETIAAFAEYGRAVGIASQIRADLYDLFGPHESRDLARRVHSLPIALFLESPTTVDAGIFMTALQRASTESAARQAVQDCLGRSGVLQICASIVESCCAIARCSLLRIALPESNCRPLRRLIESLTFLDLEQRKGRD